LIAVSPLANAAEAGPPLPRPGTFPTCCRLRSLRDSALGSFTAFLVAATAAAGAHSRVYTVSVRSTILDITRLKVVSTMNEVQKARRRAKAVRAARWNTELEGSRSTNATRADQVSYVRGTITSAELQNRIRRRYNVP
jgi:hypothetical protein